MDAKKAKGILEKASDEDIIVGDFANNMRQFCAIGYIVNHEIDPVEKTNTTCSDSPSRHEHRSKEVRKKIREINSFCRSKVEEFMQKEYNLDFINLASVNNAPKYNDYLQESPRQRVLALLDDMIEAGY